MGILAEGVDEEVNDEEDEEEEDNFASVELGVVVEATELLTAALEVALAIALVASISQAEIPSNDCTARFGSHLVPLFRGVWQ